MRGESLVKEVFERRVEGKRGRGKACIMTISKPMRNIKRYSVEPWILREYGCKNLISSRIPMIMKSNKFQFLKIIIAE